MDDKLLTTREVCEVLHLSRTTVEKLAREGELRRVEIPQTRRVLYSAADVRAFIRRGQNDEGPAGKPDLVTTAADAGGHHVPG